MYIHPYITDRIDRHNLYGTEALTGRLARDFDGGTLSGISEIILRANDGLPSHGLIIDRMICLQPQNSRSWVESKTT